MDDFGRFVFGEGKKGKALEEGKAARAGEDGSCGAGREGRAAVRQAAAHLPGLPTKTLEELAQAQARGLEPQQGRLPRLARAQHDDGGEAGFRAFNEGPKDKREVDFVAFGRPSRRPSPGATRSRTASCPSRSHERLQGGRTPAPPVTTWIERDGALLRLRLARPKANIVDAAMLAALGEALAAHRGAPGMLAALLDAEGPSFSYGASVEEHLARSLRGDARQPARADRGDARVARADPRVGARLLPGRRARGGARGQPIFAAPDAKFGQPEIKLGVFAPAASCLLPAIVGRAAAEDMLPLRRGRSTRRRRSRSGSCPRWATIRRRWRSQCFDRHLAGKSRPRSRRRWRLPAARSSGRGAAAPRRSGAPLPRAI